MRSPSIEELKELRAAGVKSVTFDNVYSSDPKDCEVHLLRSVEFFPPEPPATQINLPEGTKVDSPMVDVLADLDAKERQLKKERNDLIYHSS